MIPSSRTPGHGWNEKWLAERSRLVPRSGRRDAALVPELAHLGVRAVLADIVMTDPERESALARVVLDLQRSLE